jgi:ABC-2 type transport system ATP-binding protein
MGYTIRKNEENSFHPKAQGGFVMIEVEHLTKCYGDFTAVKDLSFTIDEGHVYGFLGPNGAGKSTTMNIMTGCLSATEGHVRIDGHDIFDEPNEAKKRIGYLPEQPPLYMNETPAEYLRFVGEAKGLRGAKLEEQIKSVMEQTKITDMRNRRISALSKGYKQRVGIAQALLGNPKVIILDEPTVGLDPIQIIEIRDLIKQLGQEHTVILSSHILSEVQTICEKILIIAHGTLIAFDDAENLEKSLLSGNGIDLTAEATQEEVRSILSSVEEVVEIETSVSEAGLTRAHLKVSGDDIYGVSRQLFFAFADAGKALLELSLKKASLEDVFIELTETKPESEMVSEPVAKAEAESSESVAEPEPESNESEETVE